MKDTEIIALIDQKLDERFRQLTLQIERLDKDTKWTEFKFSTLDHVLVAITDELTLPSGAVAQGFASLKERLEQLLGATEPPATAKKRAR